LVAEPESEVRMQLSGSRGESSAKNQLRVERLRVQVRALPHQSPPALDLVLELRAPRSVLLALEQRDQRP
jgi:hypothetical protein